jgi:hypothetical protein
VLLVFYVGEMGIHRMGTSLVSLTIQKKRRRNSNPSPPFSKKKKNPEKIYS